MIIKGTYDQQRILLEVSVIFLIYINIAGTLDPQHAVDPRHYCTPDQQVGLEKRSCVSSRTSISTVLI